MRSSAYQTNRAALLRAVPHPPRPSLPWPDLTDETATAVGDWLEWLADIWRDDEVVEAITYASGDLAAQVGTVLSAPSPAPRRVRATVLAVVRYLLRAQERPTPFGFFVGVAPAVFGAATAVGWGDDHVAVARAGALWLAALIVRLESCPDLLARLPLVANFSATVRGDRLIIPHQPSEQGTGTVEVALHHTAPLQAVMSQARSPVRFAELVVALHSQFPGVSAETVTGMLTELVARRVLISSLHAPATVPDALAHLIQQLDRVGADQIEGTAELVTTLTLIHDGLQVHNRAAASKGRALRRELTDQMTALISSPAGCGQLVVDLRLDATVVLPSPVASEVECAAHLLARLSAYPSGTREWGTYLRRFWERYGIGSLIPLADVIADLGHPDGYPGAAEPPRRPAVSRRDEVLLELAQAAPLDGRDEVVLDERLLSELDLAPGKLRPPPHLELGVRVNAATAAAVDDGDFTVEVLTVSRGAGTLTGRFLPVLDSGDTAVAAVDLVDLPGTDPDTMVVQISFPPLRPADAHLTRTGQVLPTLLSLAEHRAAGERVLTVDDMAVGCDGHRLYLAAPALERRVEAVAVHALNLQVHTLPLARLLIELGRAQAAQVTPFNWGPAAVRLPFRPRLRCGRIILASAQWRLTAAELPGRTAPWPQWETAFSTWRELRHLPRRVLLAEGDRRLPLDLDEAGHRALLRTHLASSDHARLLEAPGPEAASWCGGHAHELIATVTAVTPYLWPPLPRPTTARLLDRSHGHTSGRSGHMLAKLHSPAQLHDLLLAEHLPTLLHRLGEPPWWFLRFRDSDGPHLGLRISLPGTAGEPADPAVFGTYATTVSEWAAELHQAGLARQVTYVTSYPEVGRWGSGQAYRLAEQVFAADTHAICAQLRTAACPDRLALAATHTTAIAVAFTGDAAAGMRWLIDHLPAASLSAVARPAFRGQEITTAWQARAEAVASYRAVLPDVEQSDGDCAGIIPDQVLRSLLHTHFIRGYGIDRPAEALAL